ncbi:MAG: MBL fold metallo-hydrolase [Limisphaerales bacterium]
MNVPHGEIQGMFKLLFIGTRGEIEARTKLHNMHSSLLIGCGRKKIMLDCGLDWLGKFEKFKPDAIVLTHAHPDQAWGLKNGAPCPVYAPERAWRSLENCGSLERITLDLRAPRRIFGVTFEPFAVEHSPRCPAVGYRISAGPARFFCSPDVAYIPEHARALDGVRLYIGDGATLSRSMVRRAATGYSATRPCAPN